MDVREIINAAHRALRNGDRAEARHLLETGMAENEPTVEMLYLYSFAARSRDQAIHSLERAAALAPKNRHVRKRLARLTGRPDAPEPADETADDAPQAAAPEPAPADAPPTPQPVAVQPQGWQPLEPAPAEPPASASVEAATGDEPSHDTVAEPPGPDDAADDVARDWELPGQASDAPSPPWLAEEEPRWQRPDTAALKWPEAAAEPAAWQPAAEPAPEEEPLPWEEADDLATAEAAVVLPWETANTNAGEPQDDGAPLPWETDATDDDEEAGEPLFAPPPALAAALGGDEPGEEPGEEPEPDDDLLAMIGAATEEEAARTPPAAPLYGLAPDAALDDESPPEPLPPVDYAPPEKAADPLGLFSDGADDDVVSPVVPLESRSIFAQPEDPGIDEDDLLDDDEPEPFEQPVDMAPASPAPPPRARREPSEMIDPVPVRRAGSAAQLARYLNAVSKRGWIIDHVSDAGAQLRRPKRPSWLLFGLGALLFPVGIGIAAWVALIFDYLWKTDDVTFVPMAAIEANTEPQAPERTFRLLWEFLLFLLVVALVAVGAAIVGVAFSTLLMPLLGTGLTL